MTMKLILKKFNDCNKFSLTDRVLNDNIIFDHKEKQYKYTVSEEKIINNFKNVPEELRKYILSYKISSPNESATSSTIDIEYYFELNDETKKYLLKFRNDFCLEPLEDLTLYKDDELKFWSSTHEEYNSIGTNYKNMSKEEIADFINDKYFNEDNSIIIDAIYKLIEMPIGNKFSFEELNINDSQIISIICHVCNHIQLNIERLEQKRICNSSLASYIQDLSLAMKLFDDGKEQEAIEKFKRYECKEGFYEPLLDEDKENYDKKIMFKKRKI